MLWDKHDLAERDRFTHEALENGHTRRVRSYLERHHVITMMMFTLIFVGASLWSESVSIIVTKHIFRVRNGEEMTWDKWVVSALLWTVMSYFIIRRVFRLPLTAAYSY